MFDPLDPNLLVFVSELSPSSFSFPRTNKVHSVSFRHLKPSSISLRSETTVTRSSNHTVTAPSTSNKLPNAFRKAIRSYVTQKFEILGIEPPDPATVRTMTNYFFSLAACSRSPNLFGGDTNQVQECARARQKVEELLNGCDAYTYAIFASCYEELVVESGLQDLI